MMNFRISFTTCQFTDEQLHDWLRWVETQFPLTDLNIEEVPDGSHAEDHRSPVERIRPKRVGR